MSNYRCINFYDLCRVCTASSREKVDIFGEEGRSRNLHMKVAECLSLNVNEKDRLPKKLCVQCVQHVEEVVEFRNICRNSQTTLASFLNTGNGGRLLIKDTGGHATMGLSALPSNTDISGVQTSGSNMLNITASLPTPSMHATSTVPQTVTQTGNDLITSILQTMQQLQAAQPETSNIPSEKPPVQQYTITMESANTLKTQPADYAFDQQQLQPQQQLSQPSKTEKDLKHSNIEEFLKMKPNLKVTPLGKSKDKQKIIQQAAQLQHKQQEQMAHQQQQLAQLKLQLQMQQQFQQQQLQHLQEQLNTKLHPQQFTITAPAIAAASDELIAGRNKKPKLNFVLTPPTAQGLSATLPQFPTPQAPQIQFQLQTTGTQQQQATAALLSNLAPLLQAQPSSMALTGTHATTNDAVVSPTKCYLPITIKDENSDQQIVGHLDTKNLVLPTTYQLQMKFEPQIATVDGQQIVQLAPTSIPATLQFTSHATPPTQTVFPAPSVPLQQHEAQPQKQAQSNVQITSQEIIRPAQQNVSIHTSDVATSTNDQLDDPGCANSKKPVKQTADNGFKPQRYTITQQHGSNTIEIIPTTNFTHQIMQQVQQQQKQKLQQQQQQLFQAKHDQDGQSTVTTTVPTQHGGITVQRLSTKATVTKAQQQQQQQQQQQIMKLPILSKQNVTISRVSVQEQSSQKAVQIPVQEQIEQPVETKQQHSHSKISPTKSISPSKKIVRRMNKISVEQPINSSTTTPPSEQQTAPTEAADPLNAASNGFDCSNCGRVFKKKEHLTQHVKLHAGLRPFKCTEMTCDKTFSRKEHLLRHQISHSGQKMFSCDVCQKPFSRKDNLNKHRRIHPGQPNSNNYACEVCHKTFALKTYYEQHKLLHGKSKVPDSVTNANKQPTAAAAITAPVHRQPIANRPTPLVQTSTSTMPMHQAQPHQIMHLQLPDSGRATELSGNSTITLATAQPSHDHQKCTLLTGSTTLGLTTALGNFVQLGQTQFVNAATGQLIGHINIEK